MATRRLAKMLLAVNKKEGREQWEFEVNPDLLREFDYSNAIAPIQGPDNGTAGIWVRAHGTEEGLIQFDGEYMAPEDIWSMIDDLYGWEYPILLTCCYPQQVVERYGSRLRQWGIIVLATPVRTEVVCTHRKDWSNGRVTIRSKEEANHQATRIM